MVKNFMKGEGANYLRVGKNEVLQGDRGCDEGKANKRALRTAKTGGKEAGPELSLGFKVGRKRGPGKVEREGREECFGIRSGQCVGY